MKLSILILTCSFYSFSQENTFFIILESESCKIDPITESFYSNTIDDENDLRIIRTNGISNHQTGEFPNTGNPNSIKVLNKTYSIPLNPKVNVNIKSAQGWSFGILESGIELDPFTGEFFITPNGPNRDWNITTLTNTINLGLDCNNAHVQPGGKYHYHGTPNAYLENLNFNDNSMIKLGYAADGFPIYYKYILDENDSLIEEISGYILKFGDRGGDGINSPDGNYDGTYFADYEYIESQSSLDECNGRWGKTPENDNEYYYVITDNFPSSPICFVGSPSKDFSHGRQEGNIRPMNVNRDHPPFSENSNRPSFSQLLEHMDRNNNGSLDIDEVKGPLLNDFDQLDKNKDGELTKEEMENH